MTDCRGVGGIRGTSLQQKEQEMQMQAIKLPESMEGIKTLPVSGSRCQQLELPVCGLLLGTGKCSFWRGVGGTCPGPRHCC